MLVMCPWFCRELKPADSKGAKCYLGDTCKSSVNKDDINRNMHMYMYI